MKTVGIIGGIGWLSTISYYSIINKYVSSVMGDAHSARIFINSINMSDLGLLTLDINFEKARKILHHALATLEKAEADITLIACNTAHLLLNSDDAVKPTLHICDAVIQALTSINTKKVAVLGTLNTIKYKLYNRYLENANIEHVPISDEDNMTIHQCTVSLGAGKIVPEEKKRIEDIVRKIEKTHVDAIILACTELGEVIKQPNFSTTIIDSTYVHALSAAKKIFSL